MNPPGFEQDERIREARIKAAAEIHLEGHRMLSRDRNATLHQLLTWIERKYGRDLLATYWDDVEKNNGE